MSVYAIVFIVYSVALIGIGVFWMKKSGKNMDSFMLGDRSINKWLLAFTSAATSLSGWLILGHGGYVYNVGFPSLWITFGTTFGAGTAIWIMGEKLRAYSLKSGAITVIDILEDRYYDSDKRTIRLIAAIVLLICTTVYVVAQVVATAKIAQAVFGWSYITGVLAGGLIVLVYTAVGGYLAVVWTDFFQGIIMVAGCLIAAIIGFKHVGGLENIFSGLQTIDPSMTKSALPLITIIGFIFGTGLLGYMSQPQLMVRFMSAKDKKNLYETMPIWVVVQCLLVYGIVWAGVCARVLFPDVNMLPNADPELAIIHLFMEFVPPIFAAIFAMTAFAAIMSTADSFLILASGCVTEDIIKKYLKRPLSDDKTVSIGRITVVVVGIVATLIAIRPFEVVFWITLWAWGGLTSFGPPVFLGLYWKRATREGCIAGLLSGFVISTLWSTPGLFGFYQQLHMSVPTFVVGFIFTVAVSLLTKAPPQNVQDNVGVLKAGDSSLLKFLT